MSALLHEHPGGDASAAALAESAELLDRAGAKLEANGCPIRARAARQGAAEIRAAEIPANADSIGELRPLALWCKPERLGTAARLLAELGDCSIRVRSDDGLGRDPGGRVIVTGAIAKLTPNLLERLREYEKEVDALSTLAGSGVFGPPPPPRSRIGDQLGDDIPF